MGRARRVVIVGASAAGLRCACRLARLEPETRVTVLDRRETVSWSACGLPFVLSGDIADPVALRRTAYGVVRDPAFFRDWKGVDLYSGVEVVSIDPRRRRLTCREGDALSELAWDELVLATGARARRPPDLPRDPRIAVFHEPADLEPVADGLRGGVFERVVVVGAGLVGCELAEALAGSWGVDVVLLEAADRPLPTLLDAEIAALVGAELERQGVQLLLGHRLEGIEPSPGAVHVRAGGARLAADLVLLALGVDPAAELAVSAGIATGDDGGILVDDRLATSAENVHAAGDVVEITHAVTGRPCHLPLGSLANRQGRVLADVLAGRDDRFGPVAGAAALRVFDLVVAATGLTAERARATGLSAHVAWLTTPDAAHYWPGERDVHVAITWERGTRRVLGVQAAGSREAGRVVDLATAVILARGRLEELAAIEHAYCPPLAPATDPLALAARAALNAERDGVRPVPPTSPLDGRDVVDCRLPAEIDAHPFAARCIASPVAVRRGDLQTEGPALLVCERGTRSYEAARHLVQAGRPASYLGGGLSWRRAAGRAKR